MALPALGLYAQASAPDIASAKAGIGRMKGLPGSVQQVLVLIRGIDFGPFYLNGGCKPSFFSGRVAWSWQFPAYSWLKTDLQAKYEKVQGQASRFDGAFSPVRTWLTGSLPNISQQMETASARMDGGDPAAVKSAIAQLDSQLNSSAVSLDAGYKSLSGFNKILNALLEQAISRSALETTLNNDQVTFNDGLKKFTCGADDARKQHNQIRDKVLNQFNQVEAAGKKFGVTSSQTDQDVSLVLGTLLAARGNVDNVLKSLQNASVTPAGAVQRLRLKVVAGQWRDLSTYASQQFGN
jgi:hypothetical protein